jgi:hypothetical protein
MDTNQKNKRSSQSDGMTNQPLTSIEIKGTQKRPRILLPNKTVKPVIPYPNPDTIQEPEITEPDKNVPTRINEQPPVFNNY